MVNIFGADTHEDWIKEISGVKADKDLSNLNRDIQNFVKRLPFKTVTEDYTITEDDCKIYVNSLSDITILVPDAIIFSGWRFEIKNIGTGNAQAIPFIDGQLIDDETSIDVAYPNNLVIDSDGFNWWIK